MTGGDDPTADVARVPKAIASANHDLGKAVSTSARLGEHPAPAATLHETHRHLLAVYSDIVQAIRATERALHAVDDRPETTKRITSEHADRIEEQYNGQVLTLALMLLDANRREWLFGKPDTIGADEVRRHGLTETQRMVLNDLQDAMEGHDAE